MADSDDIKGPKPPNPDDVKAADGEAAAPPQEQSAQAPDPFAGLYETHIGRLIAIARDDFGVAERPAVALAHEVMLSFLQAPERVRNVPPWLDGAISFAAEAYVLRNVVVPGWSIDSAEASDLTLPNGVLWRDVAARFTPRFRRVLELRYVEGRTVAEMAEALGTTQRYVKTLLERCLRQAARYASRLEGR